MAVNRTQKYYKTESKSKMGIADTEFCNLALAISEEGDRLGWNEYTRNGWFKDNYSVRSPWVLENEVLADALAKLRDIGI